MPKPDPARTLDLLWRTPLLPSGTGRGPKQGLSVDQIVSTAIALADASGLQAVTMRRVADLLGVVPMSLYTYVPGKAELLVLMVDSVYARMPLADHADHAGNPWRDRVTAIARDNRDLHDQHPWLTALPASRPPLGPGLMSKYEQELAAFEGLGLTDVELDACLTYVLGFVEQTARAKAAARDAASTSGMSDEQWWAENAPLLSRLFDAKRFPIAARVGTAAGAAQGSAYNPDQAYDFGLQRVLDGLAALIDRVPLPDLPSRPGG